MDEVYDEDWWKALLNGPRVFAQVVVDQSDNVVGSILIEKEKEEHRIQIGKVTVDPTYRGAGIASSLGMIALGDICSSFRTDVIYSEARTNQPTTQRVLLKSGILPAALLPGKLSVSEGLESALLMAAPDTSKRTARPHNLAPSLSAFVDTATRTFGLETSEVCPVEQSIDRFELSQLHMKESRKSKLCQIVSCSAAAPTEKSLDRMLCDKEKQGFTRFIAEASAHSVHDQKLWLDRGFRPVGYCPAWRLASDGREDIIFMFRGPLPELTEIRFADFRAADEGTSGGIWLVEAARKLIEAIYKF